MPEVKKAKRESIERAVAAYLAAGGTDEAGIRSTLESWHEEERAAWFTGRRALWSGFLRQIERYRAARGIPKFKHLAIRETFT